VHVPLADVTLLQLPMEHDHALAVDVAVWQSSLSAVPEPVQVPVHWLLLFTHLPLEQFESATHRQWPPLRTGAGVSVVVQAVPPLLAHGTELGGGTHPCPSSEPAPVHGPRPEQLLLCELGMHLPLAQAKSDVQ
jgi:hypothetical protein